MFRIRFNCKERKILEECVVLKPGSDFPYLLPLLHEHPTRLRKSKTDTSVITLKKGGN